MNTFSILDFPEIPTYLQYKKKDALDLDDGTSTNLIQSLYYEKSIGERIISVGLFSYKGKNLFCAWGYKDEEHCSAHAVMGENGTWLSPEVGCPIKLPIKNGDNFVGIQIPTIEGNRVFLFENL